MQASWKIDTGEGRHGMEHRRSRQGRDDPYRVLGVDPGASQQDIARAYRRAAQRVHPDTRPEDPLAAARFQALADAYDVLRDPGGRADYDRAHPAHEPTSQPAPPRHTAAGPHPPGSPYLLSPTPGQPMWAGPVHVEPPAAARQQGQGGDQPTARFEDLPIILDLRPGSRWGWPW
jgi:curved DNA-binding protein CbpA